MKLKPDPTLRQRMDALADAMADIEQAPLLQRAPKYLKQLPQIMAILQELVKRAETQR